MIKWNYEVIDIAVSKFYNNLIHDRDLIEMRPFKDINKDPKVKGKLITFAGWLVKKDRETYCLPLYDENNNDIRQIMPCKIKDYEQIVLSSMVYNKVTSLNSFVIKGEETYFTFKEFMDNFFNIKHSNEFQFLMFRLITVGSIFLNYNYCIATDPQFGKDSLPEVLQKLTTFTNVVTPQSAPKFKSLLENRLLIVTEFPDIKTDEMKEIEPVLRVSADGRTTYHNSKLSNVNYKTKDKYNISDLSIGFIYNRVDDYKPPKIKNDLRHKYFDFIMTPATRDRMVKFLFTGTIDLEQFRADTDAESVYTPEIEMDFKNDIKYIKYLIDNKFDLLEFSKLKIKEYNLGNVGRGESHFYNILRVFRMYCDGYKDQQQGQEMLDKMSDELYGCFNNYKEMINNNKDIMLKTGGV